MTREDVIKIMAVLRGAYPQFYRDVSRQEALDTIGLWEALFADDPYPLVDAAVKALIATDAKGFPPHIGAVKEKLRMISTQPEMTEGEAWTLVSRALRNSAYDSQREFDALPPRLQRLVGSPNQLREWAMLDADTVQSVIASNFQRSYRARTAADLAYEALPADVRALVSGTVGAMALGEGAGHAEF